MTRKEELEELARQFSQDWVDHYTVPDGVNILTALLQRVERGVWSRCAGKVEALMEQENESTDDQIWELRDWCKQQQEGL